MTAQTILPANSVTGGYEVANSLRFDSAAGTYLNFDQATATSARKMTFSTWLKLSKLNVYNILLENLADPHNSQIVIQNNGNNNDLRFYDYDGSTNIDLRTSRAFRDVSAWYHIVVAMDTTQSTASNRVKIYINGVQETALDTATYPDQNYDTAITGGTLQIGRQGTTSYYIDGYLAETVFIDGSQLAADSFGEFDEDSGIWKPIDGLADLTFGNNGFYLDYKDSSALGNDAAGSNNFTVNNLTSLDQSTDTCSTNFATINPLDVSLPSTFALSEGNLDAHLNGYSSNIYPRAFSNFQVTAGKWYVECKITEEDDSGMIGITSRSAVSGTDYMGLSAYDYRYYHDGTKMNNNSSSSYGTTWNGGDTIGIALDMDNLAVYFSLNGTFQANGDPTSGSSRTNAAFNLTAVASTPNGAYKFGIGTQGDGNGTRGQWNFGSPPYAISSGNTDQNGFGNFEYAVPTGYLSLNTKNLAVVLA